MKEKYLELLSQKYSNLGLSKSVLNSWAENLAIGTDENAEDSVLAEKVSAIEPILKATQAYGDQRATQAQKAATKIDKGGNQDPDPNEQTPAWFKTYMDSQAQKEEAMKAELELLKGQQAAVSRNEMIAKYASEYHLEGSMLDFAKAKLSSDMDEAAIKASLAESKDQFVKMGAIRLDDGAHIASSDSVIEQEEKDWVNGIIASQENKNV